MFREKDRFIFLSLNFIMVLALLLLISFLVIESIPTFLKQGVYFVLGEKWSYEENVYGARLFIVGTVIVTVLAIAMASPIGLFTALFFAHYSPKAVSEFFRPLVEVLVGIPSVVYGIFGLMILEDIFQKHFDPIIDKTLGFIHVFRDVSPNSGDGVFLASFVLMIMILPTITAISYESIKMVPKEFLEAAYSLGTTKWEVIRNVILPIASPGIIAGIVLGTMRAMGETMAIAMLVGNSMKFPSSIFDSTYVITSKILMDLPYYFAEREARSALIALGLLLLLIEIIFVLILRAVYRFTVVK
ncbi:MAG: phosphate ABC transporter permease subunit PstC [Archaeoglobaceae archaeon]